MSISQTYNGENDPQKKKLSFTAKNLIWISAFIFLLAGIIFLFISSKGIIPDGTVLGLGIDKTSINNEIGVMPAKDDLYMSDTPRVRLTSYPERDISKTVSDILTRKEEEAKAIAEAARIDELNHIAQAKNNRARLLSEFGLPPLSEINWDQGKASFLAEWTVKIDAYLSGSPLSGQGSTFANAAWEHGIDPRWSPAISNTESSKGENCFLPHNAWGWGQSSWSNWEDAINNHVEGLSTRYGYSISINSARTYCPPNSDNWYNNTLAQMASMG